jgi:hypothetical protein
MRARFLKGMRRKAAIVLDVVYEGATALLPVALGVWVHHPLLQLSHPPVYFIYSSVLLFGSDFLILTALGADLIRRALTGTFRLHRPPLLILILLGLAGWAILSAAWSVEPRLSAYIGFHLAGITGWILSLSERPKAWRSLSIGCMLGILLQTSVAVLEVLVQSTAFLRPLPLEWPGPLDPSIPGAAVIELPGGRRWLRAYGTLPHPNLLGFYLVGMMAGPAAWGLRPDRRAVIGGLGFGLGTLGVGLSFSRAAWLGWAAIFLGLLGMPQPSPRRRLSLLLIGATAWLIVAGLFPIQMITRLTGRGSVLEIRSVQERKWLIEQAWQQIWHHPLLGTGAGTFPLTLREILPPGYRAEPVHHVGALIFAELGLPGFGFGLALFGAFLHEGRRRKDPEARAIAACLFGLLIASTLDHPLWTMAPMRALGGSLLGAWLGRQKSEDAGDQGPPASDEKKLEGPDGRQRPCRR